MPTTAKATTSEATTSNHHTQTVDGEAFSPVTDRIHHHGQDPEAPGPETLEGLAEDVQRISVYLMEAAGILKTLAERHDDKVSPMCWATGGLAKRASRRLSELSDALHQGHTQNVGHRIEDVGTMALHARGATDLAWETAEQGKTTEMQAGSFAVASNALDYCQRRLDHLLYEADLPLD
jgi:hypothetical protein